MARPSPDRSTRPTRRLKSSRNRTASVLLTVLLVVAIATPRAIAAELADTDTKHYHLMYALSWPSAWPPPSAREMSKRQRMTGIEIEPAGQRTVTTTQFIADFEQKGYNSNLLAIPIAGGADIVAKLVPIAKVGEWGIFGPPGFTSEDQAYWLAALREIQRHDEVRPKIAETGLQVTIGSAAELIQALNAPENQRLSLETTAGDGSPITHQQQLQLYEELRNEMRSGSGPWTNFSVQAGVADPTWAIDSHRSMFADSQRRKLKSVHALYVTANTPQSALSGLKPLVRLGGYGIFVDENLSPAMARDFEHQLYRALNAPAFRERLGRLGLSPAIGDADDLRQLMASLPGDAGPDSAVARVTAATPARAAAGSPKVIAEAGDPNQGGYVAVYDQPQPAPEPSRPPDPPMGRPIIMPPDGPATGSRAGDPPGPNLKDNGRRIGSWQPVIRPEARKVAREQLTAHQQRMAEKAEKNRQLAAERSQRLRELTARNNREAAAILKKVQDDRNKWLADRRAHRTAQINRHDAITYHGVVDRGGVAHVRLTNNTDLLLHVTFEWVGTINGERQTGTGTTMIGGKSTAEAMISGLNGNVKWVVDHVKVRWTGDPVGVIL